MRIPVGRDGRPVTGAAAAEAPGGGAPQDPAAQVPLHSVTVPAAAPGGPAADGEEDFAIQLL